jgi:alkylation response protein AidB-like acyl-CoA dehydrogenase
MQYRNPTRLQAAPRGNAVLTQCAGVPRERQRAAVEETDMSAIAYEYPDDIRALREGVDAFLKAEVFTRHQRHEALLDDDRKLYTDDGRFSPAVLDIIREIRMASAKAGFYAMCAPEEIGGQGLGHVAWFGVWEKIFHTCGYKHWLGHYAVSHWAMGPSPVLAKMTAEARRSILPDMMAGKTSMCFGLSEPDAGSDAAMIKTRAVADGNGWRLSGNKIWTTNSPHAEYCIVFAVTDADRAAARKGGISAFLVPTDSPGFKIDRIIKMWGSAGGDEALLHFDEVRIEPHQLVGDLHRGFATAMLGVNLGRIYNSARAVGVGRWALEMGFEYAKVRHAFGQPIAEYQGVTFPLAESAMQIHAAHLMSLNVSQLLDRGLPARKELSMTKAFAVQAGAKALDNVMQVHGAMGMTNELNLTEAYVSMRKINIADGSNEILRRAIARAMLDGDTAL